MPPSNLACILSIAGTDPSGGAGIQADIKAISATGGYAAAVITALVAQNTQAVQGIQSLLPEFVKLQLTSVFSDLNIRAVKVGMLHSEEIINVVVDAIKQYKPKHVVLDPVMVAKDGSALMKADSKSSLQTRLAGVVTLMTPNLIEAQEMTGQPINHHEDMKAATLKVADLFQTNVLLKGGHLNQSVDSTDLLYLHKTKVFHWFYAPRIMTKNTHGTGCSLSSAIASYLGQGYSLLAAIKMAKEYLSQAIQAGANHSIGYGNGPIDHFYFLQNRQEAPLITQEENCDF